MKKIVVIGNSVAAIRALEEIRAADKESEITVFSYENHFAYWRHNLAGLFSKDVPEEKVFYKPNNFYAENKINVIFDKKISRVDFKRSRVITEEKESFSYDVLMIADGADRFPETKGISKVGVFSLHRLSGIKNILAVLPVIDAVVIEGGSIATLKAAVALRARNKEVILVVPGEYVLSHLLDREPAEILKKHLGASGIRVFTDNALSEILGNGDVKAVRLKTGKVLAAQAVLMDEVSADLKLFAESPLRIEKGIFVDEHFRTNLENVFAVDRVCAGRDTGEFLDDDEISTLCLLEQGKAAGSRINGQPVSFVPPARFIEIDLSGFVCTLIGRTRRLENNREWTSFDPSAQSYKKIFMGDGFALGAVLVNTGTEKDKIVRLIQEKTTDIAALKDCLFGQGSVCRGADFPTAAPEMANDTNNLEAVTDTPQGSVTA